MTNVPKITDAELVEDGPRTDSLELLLPILHGQSTPEVAKRVESFTLAVDQMFDRWVSRRPSKHTQRSYRQSVMHFVQWLKIEWPQNCSELLEVTVADVQAYRDALIEEGFAPATRNHRICAVSAFFKFMRECAIELRLPINVPDPANSQFIGRESCDPVYDTKALTLAQARRLRASPSSEEILDIRDRAIIDTYLFLGIRIATGCRLNVSDFHWSEEDPRLRLNEKGNTRRTIGVHFQAAQSIRHYIESAGLVRGPLFRPRTGPQTRTRLANRHFSVRGMNRLLTSYLEQLPGAMIHREEDDPLSDKAPKRCIFTVHSLRATTATLLLDAGEDIRKVQQLLGHKQVTTTQIYDKRRVSTRQSASHSVPI